MEYELRNSKAYTVGIIQNKKFVSSLETAKRTDAFEHAKKLAALGAVGIIKDNCRSKTYQVYLRARDGFYIERI